jgi:hypothetical protein
MTGLRCEGQEAVAAAGTTESLGEREEEREKSATDGSRSKADGSKGDGQGMGAIAGKTNSKARRGEGEK